MSVDTRQILFRRILAEEIELSDALSGDDEAEKHSRSNKIEIRCSEFAASQLYPLLRQLKYMGDAGASRAVKIENYDGEDTFGFDGDGPSSIDEILVNGEEIKWEND